jgi:thiol-disulfide isomerase/thioredoxin
MRCFCLFLLCGSFAVAQDKPSEKPKGDGHAVQFKLGATDSPHAPRFSPPGTQIKLVATDLPKLAGKDHLTGRIPLGTPETRGDGRLVVLARSEAGKPYDMLFIDNNLDGSVLDEKSITIKPNINREKWWSSFTGTLKVNHAAKGADAKYVEYPASFWAVVEKPEATPEVLRYTRRGYLTGTVSIGEAEYTVGVCDGNNDGVLGVGDWWAISRTKGDEALGKQDWRRLPDFCWGGGKAWKLELTGTDGAAGKLFPFDAGITQADDEAKRDRYKPDRDAARAAKAVSFEKDYDAALKKAAAAKQPVYLKFETDWCGPCKIMTALVFTAKDVATAAEGIVCVTIDGDKHKDLTEKYKVTGYPTGVMLDATGKEIARTSGYQSVKELSAFFGKHKK